MIQIRTQPVTEIRIILVSDTHLGIDLPVHPRIRRVRRGEDFFNNFSAVLNYARTHNADFLVHGGDLFFRSRVNQGLINRTYQMLYDIAGRGIKVLLVPGNHERGNLPSSLFLSDVNIHVFDRPRSFTFMKENHRVVFCGFPFQKDDIRKNFKVCLRATGWSALKAPVRFLCLHQVVEGATVGPKNFCFLKGEQTIAMKDLPPQFTAVLAGHIHRAQILHRNGISKYHRLPVIYSGAIERTSYAERYEQKGFYDLRIRLDSSGKIVYRALDFLQLPTRPMEQVLLPLNLNRQELSSYIESQVRYLHPRSIVYFHCISGIKTAKPVIPDAAQLRCILPAEMIGKFTRSCFA